MSADTTDTTPTTGADEGRLIGQRSASTAGHHPNPEAVTTVLAAGRQRSGFDQPGAYRPRIAESGRKALPAGHHCGLGALATPPMRDPGPIPLPENQPWFISRAKRAGRPAQ